MKVLRIIARLNVGGPAKHVVWLTERLNKRGHPSVLVAGTVPEGEGDMSYFAAEHGVEPIYIRQMSRELSPKDIVSLFRLYRVIGREQPDVIHTHTAKAGTLGRVAALMHRFLTWRTLIGKPRKVRVVHTFHGHVLHSYYGGAKTRVFVAIERLLARFATDKIIAISGQQRKEINGDFGIGRASQFEVIPLGLDLESFNGGVGRAGLRTAIGASEQSLVVGCIGRLTEIKDVPLFLKGAAECSTMAGGDNISWVVVGDGHLRPQLEQLASELGIDGRTTFLGNRDDIPDLVKELDIVALTSLNEGTPLSLIEAMAAGKCVVATPVGGVMDLLGETIESKNGFDVRERGVAVTSREPRDFASALIYAAQNEKLRESLSRAGQKYVRQNYSIDRLEGDILRLYESLLAE